MPTCGGSAELHRSVAVLGIPPEGLTALLSGAVGLAEGEVNPGGLGGVSAFEDELPEGEAAVRANPVEDGVEGFSGDVEVYGLGAHVLGGLGAPNGSVDGGGAVAGVDDDGGAEVGADAFQHLADLDEFGLLGHGRRVVEEFGGIAVVVDVAGVGAGGDRHLGEGEVRGQAHSVEQVDEEGREGTEEPCGHGSEFGSGEANLSVFVGRKGVDGLVEHGAEAGDEVSDFGRVERHVVDSTR